MTSWMWKAAARNMDHLLEWFSSDYTCAAVQYFLIKKAIIRDNVDQYTLLGKKNSTPSTFSPTGIVKELFSNGIEATKTKSLIDKIIDGKKQVTCLYGNLVDSFRFVKV